MPNKIKSLIEDYGYDIVEKAKQQDQERRIREDNDYFEKTGINRIPLKIDDPLVPIGNYPDIADDGDTYDENYNPNHHTADGEFAEDKPTYLIKDRTQVDPKEKAAYEKREKVKQEKEFEDKKNKRKNKFTNAIRGLVLDEDND